jgi:hypothetical protein
MKGMSSSAGLGAGAPNSGGRASLITQTSDDVLTSGNGDGGNQVTGGIAGMADIGL